MLTTDTHYLAQSQRSDAAIAKAVGKKQNRLGE